MTIKAIETRYKGYRFRSRSEARLAILMDAMGLDWEYEPEGFDLPRNGYYLPDFFVRYPDSSAVAKEWPGAGYWIEVKGSEPTSQEIDKLIELAEITGHKSWVFFNGIGANGRAKEAKVLKKEKDFQDKLNEHLFGKLVNFRYKDECGEIMFSAPIFMSAGKHESYRYAFFSALEKARAARFEHGENG